MLTATSFLDLGEHVLEHLHQLLFAACSHWVALALLQQHFMTCPPAVGYVLLSWVLVGPNLPGCFFMGPWVPNLWLFVSLHVHLARVSSTVDPQEHLQEHILASRQHLPRTTGMSITLSMY